MKLRVSLKCLLSNCFSLIEIIICILGDGEVYIWNIKQRKCEHRFFDDGSLKTKSIAVSRDQKYIATGYDVVPVLLAQVLLCFGYISQRYL